MLERFKARGLVRARGKQRTDSTHVLAAVHDLHLLELVAETLRATLEDLAAVTPDWLRGIADFVVFAFKVLIVMRASKPSRLMHLPHPSWISEEISTGGDGLVNLDVASTLESHVALQTSSRRSRCDRQTTNTVGRRLMRGPLAGGHC